MSELQKRLRGCRDLNDDDYELVCEAADEIDRLQAIVDKLQDALLSAHSLLGVPFDTLREERCREVWLKANRAIGGMDGIHDIMERQAAENAKGKR